ncbi:MAG: methylmalonyl Co-A mutase-associated GTPase MeaB [Burkholderiales bacterium]
MKTSADPSAFDALLAGDRAALGAALSVAEAGGDPARALLARLRSARAGPPARIVGVTGPPGSGKSTLVNELAVRYAGRGQRVAVVAVDPTSPYTGGAVLGDRVRMSGASRHPGVFIRSAATRGLLGGVARATMDFVRIFEAVGYDPILVETVGIGQSEVDIARIAHTAVVVEAPGLGDAVQAMKAGVLEIASVLCVNKADLPGADAKVNQLNELADRAAAHAPGWRIPVVSTVASTGEGLEALMAAIAAHGEHLRSTDRLSALEHARALAEIRAALEADRVDRPLADARRAGRLDELARAVAARSIGAAEAAATVDREFATVATF